MSDIGTICERHGDRAAGWVLQAPLAVLADYHLELRCDCGRTTIPAVKLLIRSFGPQHRLVDLVRRATCKPPCRKHFARAWLCETAYRAAIYGSPPGWSVQLVPLPALNSHAMPEAAE